MFVFKHNTIHKACVNNYFECLYKNFESILKYVAYVYEIESSDAKYFHPNTKKLQSYVKSNLGEIHLQKNCILTVLICTSKDIRHSVPILWKSNVRKLKKAQYGHLRKVTLISK